MISGLKKKHGDELAPSADIQVGASSGRSERCATFAFMPDVTIVFGRSRPTAQLLHLLVLEVGFFYAGPDRRPILWPVSFTSSSIRTSSMSV